MYLYTIDTHILYLYLLVNILESNTRLNIYIILIYILFELSKYVTPYYTIIYILKELFNKPGIMFIIIKIYY